MLVQVLRRELLQRRAPVLEPVLALALVRAQVLPVQEPKAQFYRRRRPEPQPQRMEELK